jgi:hypothetical protein
MDEVAEIMEAVTYTQAPVSMHAAPMSELCVSGCCQIGEVKYLWGSQEGPLLPHTHTQASCQCPRVTCMHDYERHAKANELCGLGELTQTH